MCIPQGQSPNDSSHCVSQSKTGNQDQADPAMKSTQMSSIEYTEEWHSDHVTMNGCRDKGVSKTAQEHSDKFRFQKVT